MSTAGYKITFQLIGTTPLLMHADNIEEADILNAWRKDQKNKSISKAGDDRSPAWTWQAGLYHDGDKITMPADCLMACLRGAGAKKIMQKQKTFKEATQSGMFTDSEYLDFLCQNKPIAMASILSFKSKPYDEHMEAVKKLGFSLFAKRARVGTSKHIRVRARFDDWKVCGTMAVSHEALTLPVVQEIFELAGNVGLGDWRPGGRTPGPYGMFTAKVTRA